MPLVLSLRKGDDFYVGSSHFVLCDVLSDTQLEIESATTGKKFTITHTRQTEIMPDVMVSAGGRQRAVVARVVIDAPRDLLVVRGDKWRNPPEHIKARRGG
jgi:hypothetical protein